MKSNGTMEDSMPTLKADFLNRFILIEAPDTDITWINLQNSL